MNVFVYGLQTHFVFTFFSLRNIYSMSRYETFVAYLIKLITLCGSAKAHRPFDLERYITHWTVTGNEIMPTIQWNQFCMEHWSGQLTSRLLFGRTQSSGIGGRCEWTILKSHHQNVERFVVFVFDLGEVWFVVFFRFGITKGHARTYFIIVQLYGVAEIRTTIWFNYFTLRPISLFE